MSSTIDGVDTLIFDAGGVLLRPSVPAVRNVLERFGRADRAGEIPKMLAEMVRVSASLDEPGLFWTNQRNEYFAAWADLPMRVASEVWAALASGGPSALPPLWSNPPKFAARTLQQLRQDGFRLAVLSNSDGTLRKILQTIGLADYFDLIVDSKEAGVAKPDRAAFEYCLKELGTQGHSVAFIGDDLHHDMSAARKAGVDITVLYDEHRLHQTLPDEATFVVNSFETLAGIFQKRSEGQCEY
ncbi:HAD family hydrolase [Curtobacterium oceanosedimentum]|uniref:HAD family hydrolase n=1 Tax=Curtobacterium oceanosedimentum TaxID=465820 RepID=UPI0009EC73A8|nr:HAD family hydrolase [Curtobacterium oceanosedimentum]